jgi:hypothetical protein
VQSVTIVVPPVTLLPIAVIVSPVLFVMPPVTMPPIAVVNPAP